MSTRTPKLMDLPRMRNILAPHLAELREQIWLNDKMGVLHADHTLFGLMMQQRPPFSINDHRLGIVLEGEGVVNVNLADRSISAGTLVYFGPGTIIHPVRISPELRVHGIVLFDDLPMSFAPSRMPTAFSGSYRDFMLHPEEGDVGTALRIMDTIWHAVHQPDCHMPTVSTLVAALIQHYDILYRHEADLIAKSRSREQTIFDRFLQLVNEHCTEHRHLAYYAQRICLTQRYLGSVVSKTSGTTAKEWIDRALITRIKAELMHTDKSVARIADETGFTNSAFFCKFFKRMTGQTPQKYREG